MPAGSFPDEIMATYLGPTVFITHALSEALYWYRHTINACMGSLCGTYIVLRHPSTKGSGIRGHMQKTHTVSKLELKKRHYCHSCLESSRTSSNPDERGARHANVRDGMGVVPRVVHYTIYGSPGVDSGSVSFRSLFPTSQ